jgi:hypothetical protein
MTTITLSVWWVPILLTVATLIWVERQPSAGFLGGMFEAAAGCGFILLVWAVFFALMYFCK